MKKLLRSLLVPVLALLFPACGGGGGGGGGGGATADILIGDSPVDDLLSFSATVQSVRLQRDDLSFTGDLVSSLEVEFLGLNGALAFLAHGRIPAGTYVALEIGFLPGSYLAQRGDDSSIVVINATSNTYLAPLPAPLVVAEGGYVRFTADLNLLNSLSGDAGSGVLTFSPDGSSSSDDGSEDAPIDELKGPVLSRDLATRQLIVDGFVGKNSSIHLGSIDVHVGDSAVLLDNDNMILTVEQFFAAAAPGTFLEVHGNLTQGGTVEANRIEIEDGLGGGGGNSIVRIEGIVTSTQAGGFALRIRRIKDGESIAQPVLDALGNPSTIDVSYDGSTLWVFDSGGVTSSASLMTGAEVKVRFGTFSSEPFPAREVEIDDSPGFRGELGGPGARPGTLDMRVAADVATAGQLAHLVDTQLELELGAAPIRLALPGQPLLSVDQLSPGLLIEPHGTLDARAGTLAVERLMVRPGFLLAAQLTDSSARTLDLVVDGGQFVDPFGNPVTPGPLLVKPDENCRFDGDASSADEFFARLEQGIPVGATVDVLGIAGGQNEIRAYGLRLHLP